MLEMWNKNKQNARKRHTIREAIDIATRTVAEYGAHYDIHPDVVRKINWMIRERTERKWQREHGKADKTRVITLHRDCY